MTPQAIALRVRSARHVAQDVMEFELAHEDGLGLPPASAGAHIDLYLGHGMVRQYSIANAPGMQGIYRIAVRLDAHGRGGSRWMHEKLLAGSRILASAPRCNFRLVEDAADSLLIAGGIGITPVLSMAHALRAAGRPWRLYYCARTPQHAAFLEELRSLAGPGQLVECFDEGRPQRMLDLQALVARQPAACHLYCCGPAPMLQAFASATRSRDPASVHVEHFAAPVGAPAAGGSAFCAVLARSGRTVQVPSGRSLLQALLDEGIELPHACLSGICGSCETRVLDGRPDHRDSVLGERERHAGRSMLPCVSRCFGPSLTLDL